MNYFSAGRFLPVGLFTTLDLSPSVTILRWLEILWSSPRIFMVSATDRRFIKHIQHGKYLPLRC